MKVDIHGSLNSKNNGGTYQVTYHTYLASKGRLSYSPSVECVDAWLNNMQNVASSLRTFCGLSTTSYSREGMYQALPALSYCKRQKAGRGTG